MRPLLLAVAWAGAAAIVWLSIEPSPPQINVSQGDKLGHLAAYAALMFMFALLYPSRGSRPTFAAAFVTLGIALEYAQGALGYRTFDVLDMAADAAGVAAGWLAALIAARLLH